MQNDWDNNIKDAANILVQFCAPRESIKYFNQMESEKYELKLSELHNKLSFSRASRLGWNTSELEETEEGEDQEESVSSYHDYSHKDQSNMDLQSPSSSSENNSYRDETDTEFNERYFYIDKYDNEQLKELIKLFMIKVMSGFKDSDDNLKDMLTNAIDKIPNKLWIEKQTVGNDKDTGYHYNDQLLGEDKIIDFIEDKIDATNQYSFQEGKDSVYNYATKQVTKSSDNKHSENILDSHEESEYLIYERHFESQPFNSAEEGEKDTEAINENNSLEKDPIYDDDLNTEDLGIIDLEDDDVFDNIDDDKLPFLKNTYSKKNRPNNSKSVAAGSKSKANRIDFGREDVGPDTTPKNKSETSTPEKEPQIKPQPENDLKVDDIEPDTKDDFETEPPKPQELSQEEVEEPKEVEEVPEVQDIQETPQEHTIPPSESQVKDIEIDDLEEESEGEDDINKYLDFEDNDEDEGDDEIEFQKFKEKDETELQKEDSKEDQSEELDVFDIWSERKITDEELKTPKNEEEDKETEESKSLNIEQRSHRKELSKTPLPEISIKTTIPSGSKRNIQKNKITDESNTAPIYEPKIKALGGSKSTKLATQISVSPKAGSGPKLKVAKKQVKEGSEPLLKSPKNIDLQEEDQ